MLLTLILLFSFERLDWHFILKTPYFFPKVGEIPFWKTKIAQHNPLALRLANSLVGSKGHVVSGKVPYKNFRIEAQFRVTGGQYGGNGFAIYFAEDPKFDNFGPLGVAPNLKGVGIIFNGNSQSGMRQHTALVQTDGAQTIANSGDYTKYRKEGCFNNYRNSFKNYLVKLTYKESQLSLALGDSDSTIECFSVKIDLPKDHSIVIGAESSINPDDHDLISFLLFDLDAKEKDGSKAPEVSSEELKKVQEYEKKLEDQKQHAETSQPPLDKGGVTELKVEISNIKSEMAKISSKLSDFDSNKLQSLTDAIQKYSDNRGSSFGTTVDFGPALAKLQELQRDFKSEIDQLKDLIIRVQVFFFNEARPNKFF
eukprot:NODE_74_length_24438_cov_0.900283.p6 type:complete len:368 gc:universal NODE_74_length_24438_cov_0.900283:22011-20908(-)